MNMISYSTKLLLKVLLLWLSLASATCAQTQTENLILVGSHDTKNSFHGRWLKLIYSQVSIRLGYKLQYDSYPSARASHISDSGSAHGEINRVFMYQSKHPSMVRINEPHFSSIIAVYAVKPNIQLEKWQSLKDTGYKISYRRGTRIVEKSLTNVVPLRDLSTVTNIEQGLKKLLKGRSDLYIGVQDTVNEKLSEQGKKNKEFLQVRKIGIMLETNLHAYIHKKYFNLVNKIETILKQMKREGLIEKYRRLALEQSPSFVQ